MSARNTVPEFIVKRAQARQNALAQARGEQLPHAEVRVAASPLSKAQRRATAATLRAHGVLPEGENWAYGVSQVAQERLVLDARVLRQATAQVKANAKATRALHKLAQATLV